MFLAIKVSDEMKVKVTKDGPYMVSGGVPLRSEVIKRTEEGRAEKWGEVKRYYPDDTYMLCRCGKSTGRPFCTGEHADFDGTETAKRGTYEDGARVAISADGVELSQNPVLCVGVGFCHGKHYIDKTVKSKDTLDIALQQTYDCPGGSLLIKINGVPQEPEFEKCISVISAQQPNLLWVKGGIQVESSDGYKYEKRVRVALCSCGKSKNKPFCDAAHLRR